VLYNHIVQRAVNNVRTLRHVWIPLPDGCRLAARVWLPVDASENPVPAILEYVPYRKNDATVARDAQIHPYFASYGYASLRVDMRGSGDSDGLLLGEYLPQELDDAVAVLGWLEQQPWCSGSAGMMGKSWGGFNSLQVAALQPPQLRAVISVCSTDDRYADDVHYMGGCVLASDMLSWASTMLAYNARPPDPAVVGDAWREVWLERLEETPPFIEAWLKHQRRDEFWQHGSVCEDYSAIDCAVYMIGGWADAYTDAVLRFLRGYRGPRKGLIGPWPHAYPHDAVPGPAIGFLQECVRWWDHWLKGAPTGIMDEPMLRVWMQEAVEPRPAYAVRPGRWVAEPSWPAPSIVPVLRFLNPQGLTTTLDPAADRRVTSNEESGSDAGSWIGWGRPADGPPDQGREDAIALCFDSEPLEDAFEILGSPVVVLQLSADQPQATVCVRLCEVDSSGASLLVSRGVLNLTHRMDHETPVDLKPGASEPVRVELKAVAHGFRKGHRLRIAVTPAYWPWIWPARTPVTLTVTCGELSTLELPVRRPDDRDRDLREFGPPESGPPLDVSPLPSPPSRRELRIDVGSGRREIVSDFDFFGSRRLKDGLSYQESAQDRFSITVGDPLSAEAQSRWRIAIGRGDWQTRVQTVSTMTATADAFTVTNVVDAFEGDRRMFSKATSSVFPRDGV
jgi:putative CocE/NonD family hydrolase